MITDSIREHRLIITLAAIHVVASATLLIVANRPVLDVLIYGPKIPILLGLYCVAYSVGYLFWVLYIERPAQFKAFVAQDFRARALGWKRWHGVVIISACIGFSLSAYTAVKSAIPAIKPFNFDSLLSRADLFLHFGHAPWELLHPFIAYYPVTITIDYIYKLWFLVLYGFVFAMAFSTRSIVLRKRFFVSFILIWAVLGNVLALLIPSAGPCFFELLTGNSEPYAALTSYLSDVNNEHELSALGYQQQLWEAYLDDSIGLGTGISAAPSIHIAMVTLLTLTAWNMHRVFGMVMTAYSIVIFIGSIHLGWHYAVDGYISVVATCFIWLTVGKFFGQPDDDADKRGSTI